MFSGKLSFYSSCLRLNHTTICPHSPLGGWSLNAVAWAFVPEMDSREKEFSDQVQRTLEKRDKMGNLKGSQRRRCAASCGRR